jgi:hypothetical protein
MKLRKIGKSLSPDLLIYKTSLSGKYNLERSTIFFGEPSCAILPASVKGI